MEIDKTKITWEYIVERWHQKTTIILVILITFCTLYVFFKIDIFSVNIFALTLILLICLLELLFWIEINAPPLCQRKHVGIAIAVSAETKEEY